MKHIWILLALTACGGGPDLSGEWSGDIACDEIPTLQTEFELVQSEDDDLAFTGPYVVSLETEFTEEDVTVTVDIRLEGTIDLTLEDEDEVEGEDTTAEIGLTHASTVCSVSVDGLPLGACADYEIEVDELGELLASEVLVTTWDGENTLTVTNAGCTGTFARETD